MPSQGEGMLCDMHTTMQTLGRVAIISGSVLVATVNLNLFHDVEHLPAFEKAEIYRNIYIMALFTPLIPIAGVVLARLINKRQAESIQRAIIKPIKPNW